MNSPAFFLGYHGCEEEVALQAAAGEMDPSPSRNPYDWIGHGQYWWQDSVDRAWIWANDAAKRGKIKNLLFLER